MKLEELVPYLRANNVAKADFDSDGNVLSLTMWPPPDESPTAIHPFLDPHAAKLASMDAEAAAKLEREEYEKLLYAASEGS